MAKLTKEETTKLSDRCCQYAWRILEAKFCYYQGSKHNIKPMLSDPDYDELESKYKKACKKLKIKPRAFDLVGFPDEPTKPSHRMVAQHMIATRGKKTQYKEIKKEIKVTLKVLKKVLKKEVSEKKAKIIYKKVKALLDPNR